MRKKLIIVPKQLIANHFLEFRSRYSIKTNVESARDVVPIRNTFTSNRIDTIANSRARLNKKPITRDGSGVMRMYLVGVMEDIVETLRRNVVQGIMYKETVLQYDVIFKFKNLKITENRRAINTKVRKSNDTHSSILELENFTIEATRDLGPNLAAISKVR